MSENRVLDRIEDTHRAALRDWETAQRAAGLEVPAFDCWAAGRRVRTTGGTGEKPDQTDRRVLRQNRIQPGSALMLGLVRADDGLERSEAVLLQ